MGIKVETPNLYAASLRKLFPRGGYWDKQFDDPSSDCSLFVKAKLDQFLRFRERMSNLQDESIIKTATETIEDWERILTQNVTVGLSLEQRRSLLLDLKAGCVNIGILKNIGAIYGVSITNWELPYKPACFGFSRFGQDRIAHISAFSVVFIYANTPNQAVREEFEEQVRSRLLANNIVYFIYGGA